jgi:hypothetical protein
MGREKPEPKKEFVGRADENGSSFMKDAIP